VLLSAYVLHRQVARCLAELANDESVTNCLCFCASLIAFCCLAKVVAALITGEGKFYSSGNDMGSQPKGA
jgi:hypothetical protein